MTASIGAPGRLGIIDRAAQAVVVAGICLAAATLLFLYVRYVSSGGYYDHVEGSVVIPGYTYLHGSPLYEFQDGEPRFATLYGPLAYLIQALAMAVLGPYVISGKIFSGLALLATVVLLFGHFRRHATFRQSCNGMLLLLGGLVLFAPISFWVRPDPFETLLVAVAVVAVDRRWSVVGVGVCIGLAANFKIHAFAYFIPVIFELHRRQGVQGLVGAAGFAWAAFVTPFLLPNVLMPDYLISLAEQAGRPTPAPKLILPAIWAVLLLCFPIIFALVSETHSRSRKDMVYVWATFGTIVLLLYPATMPGAGPYHFMPLLPVLADVYMRMGPSNIRARLFPWMILFNGLYFASQSLGVPRMVADWRVIAGEAVALAQSKPDRSVQIGFGDNLASYNIMQLSRVMLTLNGYPPLIDAQVLMELGAVHIDGSKRWIRYLTQCRGGLWLLPAGEAPFAMPSYYPRKGVFSRAFRQAFRANYRRTGTEGYFDLWECTHGTAQ